MKFLRNRLFLIGSALVLAGVALIVTGFVLFHESPKELARAELEQLIASKALIDGRVTPTLYPGIYQVEGKRIAGNKIQRVFISTHLDEAQVKSLLEPNGTKIEMPGQSMRGQWLSILSTLIVGGVVIFIFMKQMNIGHPKSAHVRHRPTVAFSDVAGIEEAKGEVQEIVDFLRDPAKYQRLGGSLPKGVLLIGPPGTGKTMLAKAIASEANASFFSAHGSDFTEVFVGVRAKRGRH